MPKSILIADDDKLFLDVLTFEFEKRNAPLQWITVEDGEHTIKLLTEHKPDMLILDLRMPNLDGFAVLEHMQKHHSSVPVVIVTHFHDEEHQKKSEQYGVKAYLVKSDWHISQLAEEIERLLEGKE